MSTKRLRSGFIDTLPTTAEGSPGRLMKRALLVYEGIFESMDGEVIVNREHLDRLATNHNAQIAHATRLAGEGVIELPMKDYPPLQLDHSTSAKDTIGRLVGEIEIHPYIRKDGKEVMAAYGSVAILGDENIAKVQDGRWTHLSVGVDFEKGKFSELTITPFPAAPEASLLSRLGEKIVKTITGKREEDEAVIVEYDDGGKKYYGYKIKKNGRTVDETWEYDSQSKAENDARVDVNRLSKAKGATMGMDEEKKAKMKKHLTDKKKMSEEDAEKHLAKCSEDEEEMKKLSAEVDEDEKKMAAEEEEKKRLAAEEEEKEKEKAKEAKMTAARESLSRLSSDFRKAAETVNLAARKGTILTRLSKLRSDAKITPAEIKKMDLDKLSKEPQSTIDAVLRSYEDREPVIMVGAMGSMKAEDLGNLSKPARMSRLEMETRSNMSLLKGTIKDDGKKRMSEMPMEPITVHVDTAPHVHEMEAECAAISKMMDEGKNQEAKERMKGWMKKAMSSGSSAGAQMSHEETEKQLSSLAESAKRMQTQFEELHKLAGSLVGI